MADNLTTNTSGTLPNVTIATRQVTYSGDVAHLAPTSLVTLTGADDAKIATDVSEAAPLPVRAARPSTGAGSTVAASATSVQLLASNANRLGAVVHNDSTAVLRIALGFTASATAFTFRLQAQETVVLPPFTGAVNGIWETATGAARITELT
jgi:hypothetical protein